VNWVLEMSLSGHTCTQRILDWFWTIICLNSLEHWGFETQIFILMSKIGGIIIFFLQKPQFILFYVIKNKKNYSFFVYMILTVRVRKNIQLRSHLFCLYLILWCIFFKKIILFLILSYQNYLKIHRKHQIWCFLSKK